MPASIQMMLLPPSIGNDQVTISNDKMPMLEDDPLPLAIKKAEIISALMIENDKRLAKVEEMLK